VSRNHADNATKRQTGLQHHASLQSAVNYTSVGLQTEVRGQSNLAKAAANAPPSWAAWQTDWQTDTAIIGNNSLHLMHSMQPNSTGWWPKRRADASVNKLAKFVAYWQWNRTYKHGGDAVRERVGNDGETGRQQSRGSQCLDEPHEEAHDNVDESVRTSVNEPSIVTRNSAVVAGDSVAQWSASWLTTQEVMGSTLGPRAPSNSCGQAAYANLPSEAWQFEQLTTAIVHNKTLTRRTLDDDKNTTCKTEGMRIEPRQSQIKQSRKGSNETKWRKPLRSKTHLNCFKR